MHVATFIGELQHYKNFKPGQVTSQSLLLRVRDKAPFLKLLNWDCIFRQKSYVFHEEISPGSFLLQC